MKKEKLNILRILAFSSVLCVFTVLMFAFSDILFERVTRWLGESNDTTKNAYWLITHAQNLTLAPVVAILCGMFHRRGQTKEITATYHREKKYSCVILLVFIYFVFMPYYISQNIAGEMSIFEALGDKAIWFASQLIPTLAFIMYQSDRANKLSDESVKEGREENEELC